MYPPEGAVVSAVILSAEKLRWCIASCSSGFVCVGLDLIAATER